MSETTEWAQYQRGINYKKSIKLLETIDRNERFWAKRHWEGVKTNGLPAAVLPWSKRIGDFKIAMVMADNVAITFAPQGVDNSSQNPADEIKRKTAAILTDYAHTIAENVKADAMDADGLVDAFLSGDMASFWFWDSTISAGNGILGDINGHLVDSMNLILGDVNNPEINNVYGPVQPYIIVAKRMNVKDVREAARRNGVSEDEIRNITSDSENTNQVGDRAKTELDEDDETGKCLVLLKMWKELEEVKEPSIDPATGDPELDESNEPVMAVTDYVWHIYAKESTESVVIRKNWDTGLHRYPVALMNWERRKGSCHGEAEMTSLIPNQVVINQMASMITLWIKLHGFPKVIYDKTRITSWDNSLDKAIPVNGVDAGGVGGAAMYMQPGQLSAAVQQFFQTFITMTKEAAGANESVLGDAAPTNTSAIIVNSKNAAVPLNAIKRRYYRYKEDVALIWLDFIQTYYSKYPNRQLDINGNLVTLDPKVLKSLKLSLKIEVTPSSPFDEAAQQATLDNLLAQQHITFVEWLERVRKGSVPNSQGLIAERDEAKLQAEGEEKQFLYQLMAEKIDMIMQTLPPEAQSELKQLQRNDPPAYEAQAKQLIRRPYANNVEGQPIL